MQCSRCPRAVVPGRSYCVDHVVWARTYGRTWARWERAHKIVAGICVYTGCQRAARPGRRMCAKHAAWFARWRAARKQHGPANQS